LGKVIILTLDHGGEGVRVVGEVADHEGHEDGRRVVAGDEGHHGVVHDLLVAQQRRAGVVGQTEQARDEVAAPGGLAAVQLGPGLPRDPGDEPASSGAGPEAPAERRERQVHRDGPHAIHDAREVGGERVLERAPLQAEEQQGDDVEREPLHERHHRDGALAGPALVEVAPHLAVDLAHVQPQHVRLEELGQRAADPLVVGAHQVQDALVPEDPLH